ncbi:MAG: NAD(P)-dependent glycerol-3-phosphate dehydrogenase [Candidatus Omnitrophica bacterium]|nr:NAD(P)-dependent glycerol-3-phosphate dehydrogenase [Candidatus Omnitrophota bacterium]
MKTCVSVVGDGGWGTTLALLLSEKHYGVRLWSVFPDYAKLLKEKRENVKFLPGFPIPEEIAISSDIREVVEETQVVVLAPPSHFMRDVASRLKGIDLSKKILVSVSKGIENGTLYRMSEVILDVLGKPLRLVALSGPTIAPEVAKHLPAMAVVASPDGEAAHTVQEIFTTTHFGVYTSDDVVGVELGGSLKNVIAIAAGISDGLGFGTNAKAALFTRGLVEIATLGVKMGARLETFSGLSGMGDLVTTCLSPQSRNRSLGEAIGKGLRLEEVLKGTEMVVEGVRTTLSALELGKKYDTELPIAQEVKSVLYDGKDPLQAVKDLMIRRRGEELKLWNR